ncbi:cytochrome c oxidase assembly factor 6 homolog [Tigriopus californicus]|uniref:cytochrome c oxidase assembly factor 6 homolog n=1 Tax=Tigriopus californicus TaxID=6832 RepID=UPI0027DA8204|nr:cytochrome c oxidase assembly factor 6 homolog [Tigriopus californicus]
MSMGIFPFSYQCRASFVSGQPSMKLEMDKAEAKGEKFMKKAERKLCWDHRDAFWACMKSSREDASQCVKSREAFEQACPKTWVAHFDRKFEYEKFKENLYSKGFEEVDQKATT